MNRKGMLRALLLVTILVPFAAAQEAQVSKEPNLKELYRKVNPSVGIIHTVESVPSIKKPGELTQCANLGSGVLVSEDGKMITAAHVVQAADRVVVEFLGGQKTVGKVVASDPRADLALLELSVVPEAAVVAPLGDSDRIFVGDEIFIIGAPYGIGHVMTAGHISARHRPNMVVKNFELGEFFQTDAAINRGNSGGPMFNMQGEVVGIVSSQLTLSGGFEGIGFAVTSNTARRLLLEEPNPWSGIESTVLSDDLAKAFNLPQPEGLLVERVAVGSMAFSAGLKGGKIPAEIDGQPLLLGGDIILSVGGIKISSEDDVVMKIRKAVSSTPLNGTISVTILREGKKKELAVTRTY